MVGKCVHLPNLDMACRFRPSPGPRVTAIYVVQAIKIQSFDPLDMCNALAGRTREALARPHSRNLALLCTSEDDDALHNLVDCFGAVPCAMVYVDDLMGMAPGVQYLFSMGGRGAFYMLRWDLVRKEWSMMHSDTWISEAHRARTLRDLPLTLIYEACCH